MSEKPLVNPFEEENFLTGGGLWEGKTVTFLKVRSKVVQMGKADSPWVDPKTGQIGIQHVISVLGIADDSEYEREERYSVGAQIPTDDGEGFIDPKTKQSKPFHANSQAAKFARALAASGFDVKLLWDEKTKRTLLSKLDGAQFKMRGEQKVDKDGKPKTDKKGFADLAYFPDKFLGFKAGVGAPAPVSDALREKANATFLSVLSAAEGQKLTRIQAIKAISAALAGDPDVNKVLALFGKTEFHTDAPWKVDSTGYSL